jgi:alkylhydroperoxidase family enzyme
MLGEVGEFLMSRVPLVRPEDMTPEQRAQYDRFPSNLTRGLLLAEQRLAGALPATANALRTSGLDPKLREGIILRVAALSDSPFERMQHLGEARKTGWTEAEIAAIEAGDRTGALGAFTPILVFVDECVADIRVSDATFAAAAAALSPREIAAVLILIGHYMTVARFIANLGIELDPAPSTWDKEH